MSKALDALVANTLDRLPPGNRRSPLLWKSTDEALPRYTKNLASAFHVVDVVRTFQHGWRFSLLGGDTTMGYYGNSPSAGVDEASRVFFGWRAEFFGDADPRVCTGKRHGEAHENTRELAICIAALRAVGVDEATIEKARGT